MFRFNNLYIFIKNKTEEEKVKRRTCIKEKGITLIALVITIIIMLILAGVIISSVTSNKGILSRAKDSREVYDESKAEKSK